MSLPIYVEAHNGYKANERPRMFCLDETLYDIDAVEDQWYSPDAVFFKVRTTEGKRYLLRYDEHEDEWTLQSGFDADELFARPGIEFITVAAEAVREAEKRIAGCDTCRPEQSHIPFDWILADVLNKHGPFEFVLSETARCPNCEGAISEKMPVEPQGGIEVEAMAQL